MVLVFAWPAYSARSSRPTPFLRSSVKRVLLPRCPVILPFASSISTPARAHSTGISDELMKRHPTRISRQQKRDSTSSRSFCSSRLAKDGGGSLFQCFIPSPPHSAPHTQTTPPSSPPALSRS